MTKVIILLLIISNSYGQVCIAHRANDGKAPENSLEALKVATHKSLDGIEFDIQISKDGIPFLYHDKKLGKGLSGESCPLGKSIKKLNFSQFYYDCFLKNGSHLATFREALNLLANYNGFTFIDLKQKPSSKFYELFQESPLLTNEKVRFISFKKKALRSVKRKWPQIQTTLLSRFIPRGLFYSGIGFNKRLNLFTGLYRWLGKDVSIWTLNSKLDIQKAIKKKADFIITDQYQLCLDSI